MKCTHHACRCRRAEELARMADATGNARYLRKAIAAHLGEVECRQVKPKLFVVPKEPPCPR